MCFDRSRGGLRAAPSLFLTRVLALVKGVKIHGALGHSLYIHIVKTHRMFTPASALYGHTSCETALVVKDYPYGFRLRTEIRYWIETVPRKGDRFVSQTVNPKTGLLNTPKKSTYLDLGVMHLDGQGHCTWSGLSMYAGAEEAEAFTAAIDRTQLTEQQQKAYDHILRQVARHKAQ